MEKCFKRTQKNMKLSLVLALLLMGAFIGVANATPPVPTGYKGYVSDVNGMLMNNTLVTVYANGAVINSTTSLSDGTYFVYVPWVSGETLTFGVSGKTAGSAVMGPNDQGNIIRLDLNVPATPTSGGSSGGSGGGGGGGGGVVSGESFGNIAKSESNDEDLVANTPVTYTFKTPELGVYEIALTGKENELGITLKIEDLKGTSSQVTAQPPGTVYKNINIIGGTQKIKEAVVRFRIENSWLASNGFEASDVALLHWDGSQWTKLETAQTKTDNTYTYYEAKVVSFSPFAITGLKGGIMPTATPAMASATATETQAMPTATVTPAPTKKVPAFEFILTIAILSTAYLFGRKRR
ncbi:MAG: PGF-pre-PGF domain-containing protein [Candidatus Methanoperedens sp.]